jgi:DNA-directed RNA polymerase sigma subunit (sigma70/sigma32)
MGTRSAGRRRRGDLDGWRATHPLDVLAFYLKELRQLPPLSPDERAGMVAGDEGAAHQLIHRHLRLVVKIAGGSRSGI